MEIAVEAGVDPQSALSHTVLLQVSVEREGPGPVEPNDCQVTVHREGRQVLGGWREGGREREGGEGGGGG